MIRVLLWAGLLLTGSRASASSNPPDQARLRGFLQAFVDASWGSRFEALGDEDDFDHGHLLLDARTGAPVAILYHTRELTEPVPAERSWIQWLDGRGVESAYRYERTSYPKTAEWEWFVAQDLPKLKSRHTVLDKMLDPALGLVPGPQWTFNRTACGENGPDRISISLPNRTSVCLKTGLM